MSSPYVYAASSYQPTPYLDPYTNQPSPFIPNLSLFPASPYHSPHGSAPNTPQTRYVHFDDENYETPPPRARRPSWHAGMTPHMHVVQPYVPAFIPSAPSYSHQRRHSFGAYANTPWSAYAQPFYPAQPVFQIHPYLNGESPRSDFYFDLSSPSFAPAQFVGPAQIAFLSNQVLFQQAVHPPTTRLRIICDVIPQWPIDLQYNPSSPQVERLYVPYIPTEPGPITVNDVLVQVHRSLHTRISHMDWARLSPSEEISIAKAYTRRCRSIPSLAQFETSQGVRRVDYLLDRVIFQGLLRRSGEEGFETMSLVVGRRR